MNSTYNILHAAARLRLSGLTVLLPSPAPTSAGYQGGINGNHDQPSYHRTATRRRSLNNISLLLRPFRQILPDCNSDRGVLPGQYTPFKQKRSDSRFGCFLCLVETWKPDLMAYSG